MKNSIARKITKQVALFLILALVVLFAASFFMMQRVVVNKNEQTTLAIATVYTDLMIKEAEERKEPLDAPQSTVVREYGDYICQWYKADCAFLAVPKEQGKFHYIGISSHNPENNAWLNQYGTGATVTYPLPKNVQKVWEGKKDYATVPVETVFGREICTFVRVEDSFGKRYLAGVDISYTGTLRQIAKYFFMIAVIILAVVLFVYFSLYYIIQKRVSYPTRYISQRMNDFVAGGEKKQIHLSRKSFYEYELIADSFNRMTESIDAYLKDIGQLTREQERQAAELSIAAEIQRGFLPKETLNTPFYEVHASMTPAKDIGGDLYDYVSLDDRRILLTVADVSGKGITASIFMAVVLTLVRQFAKMNLSPGEILKKTNDMICENNPSLLFATAFVGIYDTKDRSFTYANAGHNIPYRLGREVTPLGEGKGVLLGIFPEETYENARCVLAEGDSLFLYTDGVTEAMNRENELFGETRLTERLKTVAEQPTGNPADSVAEALNEFVGDGEHHDDVTMLALTVRSETRLTLDVRMEEFEKIKTLLLQLPLPREKQLRFCLAAEECFANICFYAFEGPIPPEEKITVILKASDGVELTLEDGGIPFNPLEEISVPEDYDLDTRIGGLGKEIALSGTDEMKYEYVGGKNRLTLTVKYKEELL